MDDSAGRTLFPAASEESAASLSAARSITVIVHGVGDATNEGLLKAASEGYLRSEMGGMSKRVILEDCPTVTGEKRAESLLIQMADGSAHFVVALSWAQRRTRLSAIARVIAGLLLVFTVAMSLTFVFRGTLESLEHWLGSWTHRLIAYGVLTAFSFVAYLFKHNPTDREFQRPSMFYLFLPPVLLIGLLFFVEGTWTWMVVAALVVGLWMVATLIVGRCVAVAPSLGWRVALVALIAAMSIPSASIVRMARHSAKRAEDRYREASDPFRMTPLHLPPEAYRKLFKEAPDDRSEEDAPATPAKPNVSTFKATPSKHRANGKAAIQPNRENRSADSAAQTGNKDLTTDINASDPLFNDRQGFMKALSNYKPSIVDLVTGPEFIAKATLAAICMALCLLVMGFHWLLDLGFDVLHYGGNEKHRTALIEALAANLRWLHSQAPNASILVVAHSLGTVLAAQTLAGMSTTEPWLDQVVLVTLGSPLNYIGRAFPQSIGSVRPLAAVICAAKVRWINLWRQRDPIGKFLDIGDSGTLQYCVEKGGHMGYWSGGAVWRSVAFQALGIGDPSRKEAAGGAKTCLFERNLALLVFCSIVALTGCGAGLWLLPF